MEFRYNLNDIFKNSVIKINNTLLPSSFTGDRRSAQTCVSQISDIIDTMGYASGKAQNLQHPITTADKMRNFDHTLYLMIDRGDNNGRGSVVGLLKIGTKNLFLFDQMGMVHEKKSLCILDFYVHESKQRNGFGKKLYDYMLHDINIKPCKLAIDKPSDKFLSFLHKHYGMDKILPQNNNFVLFEGFFSSSNETNGALSSSIMSKPKSADRVEKDDRNCFDNHSVQSGEYLSREYGRHAAFKPHDSMSQCLEWLSPQQGCIHNPMNHHASLW